MGIPYSTEVKRPMPATTGTCALALDIGTTAVKAALFDADGRTLAEHGAPYDLLTPGPDQVELDPETYWRGAVRAARAVLRDAGAPPERVGCVGVTSQGETLIAVDAAGRPLRNAIVWLDNRSGEEARAIEDAFGVERVHRRTGQQEIVPSWTATKILWLRRREPETFEKAARFLLAEDYVLFRLTGEFVTDRGLNPSTLYYDLIEGEWWGEMLDFLGIGPERLPRLAGPGGLAGELAESAARDLGLAPGTPVATAPIDQVTAAAGAGNVAPGIVTETTGTALAICATVDRPLLDPQRRMGLYAHARPGHYALLPWAPAAGMVLRWFRDEMGGGRDEAALIAEAEAVPPGAEGLVLLPHLCGAGCPEMNPKARGVFWGVGAHHKRAHFTRAILESVAFMLRENLECLRALGAPVRELRSLGGGARSEAWLRIKADVCNMPVHVMQCRESAALGAAMLAMTATGAFASLDEAQARMARVARVIEPTAEADAYDAPYQRGLELYKNVQHLFT